MISFWCITLVLSFITFTIGYVEDDGNILIPSVVFGIISFTILIILNVKPNNNITLNKQKLIEHSLLQHNSKTGELEPIGKLKEIMEEIK